MKVFSVPELMDKYGINEQSNQPLKITKSEVCVYWTGRQLELVRDYEKLYKPQGIRGALPLYMNFSTRQRITFYA